MDIRNAPPPSLAELIDLDVRPSRVWQVQELGDVLAHELSVPLRLELGELRPETAAAPSMASSERCDGLWHLSIGELLHHPRPPLDMLLRLKRFAKAARLDPQSHLPEDVAGVLYALAIAAALLRHARRISSMSDPELSEYLAWALHRPWLDRASIALLSDVCRTFGPGGASAASPRPA